VELAHLNIRAIIFDVYGTLLQVGPPPPDAETRWQRLFRDLLGVRPRLSRLEFAVASSKAIAQRHEAARARQVPWPEVCWPAVVASVLPELTRLSRQAQAEFLFRQIQAGHTTCMPVETAAALRRLESGPGLLGIASNAQAYTLRELQEALAVHGLDLGLFDRDLCFWSFEHGFSKPDPHVFRILTARLEARGVRPSETLMVGDRADNDLAPAQLAGWRTWQLRSANAQAVGPGGDWQHLLRALGCEVNG
jgi:putative hydrolase of the HAD superfamily